MSNCGDVSLVLLAGGIGSRMEATTPKQYLNLGDKPLAAHSLELLANISKIHELIIVCDFDYQQIFLDMELSYPIHFAQPGPERQHSVYNGLKATAASSQFICIHDAARPLVSLEVTERCIEAARLYGAAAAAVPVKSTLKRIQQNRQVELTLDRSLIWEVQTPQVIEYNLLHRAFNYALKHGLQVTDDVSLVEALGEPVQLVMGDYHNIKIIA